MKEYIYYVILWCTLHQKRCTLQRTFHNVLLACLCEPRYIVSCLVSVADGKTFNKYCGASCAVWSFICLKRFFVSYSLRSLICGQSNIQTDCFKKEARTSFVAPSQAVTWIARRRKPPVPRPPLRRPLRDDVFFYIVKRRKIRRKNVSYITALRRITCQAISNQLDSRFVVNNAALNRSKPGCM